MEMLSLVHHVYIDPAEDFLTGLSVRRGKLVEINFAFHVTVVNRSCLNAFDAFTDIEYFDRFDSIIQE